MPAKRIWLRRGLQGTGCWFCLWAGSLLLYHFTSPPDPPRPLRIAHRGGAALAPENTLAAFEAAEELGVDYWETDVRQSRDGQLFLMHDRRIDRTTTGQGELEELDAARLSALQVPTFAQFLRLANHKQAQILPEVKGQSPGIEEALLQAIHKADMQHRTCVQSFSTRSLNRLHELSPQLPLCQTFYPWRLWVGTPPPGVSVVAPMAESLLINPWMVRQAHHSGLQVWPWFAGLESKFTIQWVLNLGVDGLMVDDPRLWPN
jgi:glycerophosphoryl diester phosphodiesterase